MPGLGSHRWEFVGKPPIIFLVVLVALTADAVLSVTLNSFAPYFIPSGLPNSQICPELAARGINHAVPEWMCWFADWNFRIFWILFGLGTLILLIYRKKVRYNFWGR